MEARKKQPKNDKAASTKLQIASGSVRGAAGGVVWSAIAAVLGAPENNSKPLCEMDRAPTRA